MEDGEFKRISVLGLGYIGLPTAAMFASRKFEVIGVDIDSNTVETVNKGEIHIVEPGLDMVVHAAVVEGYLRATVNPEPADAFLIAVPTPLRGNTTTPDLSYVEQVCSSIAPVLRPGNLVVLESTCPVGSTEAVAKWLAVARPDLTFPGTHGEDSDIRIAHCPERVLPGRVMQELIDNDRLIGGLTQRCAQAAARLYRSFVIGECIIASGPRVVEMAKLTENSFRDVNIAFANELSLIADDIGVNVWELISLANRHPRVNILQPGPGVGGHCIAVDPWFIVSSSPGIARLIRSAREVNDAKPKWVINQVKAAVADVIGDSPERSLRDVAISVYGLTFKANIDDLRQSPALEIARELGKWHAGILRVVEPFVSELPAGLEKFDLTTLEKAKSADIHVLLVDHTVFRAEQPQAGRVIDTRGIWQRELG